MKIPLLVLSMALVATGPLFAGNRFWDGTANDNWHNNNNWTGGGTPSASDTAVFPDDTDKNTVDLSDTSNVDKDRSVDLALFATKNSHSTTQPGFEVDWYLKKGRMITNTIRWDDNGTIGQVRVFADFLVDGTTLLNGSQPDNHNLRLYGNIEGSGILELNALGETVYFHAAQNFSGIVKVIKGTLAIRHDNAFSNARVIFANSTGSLNYTGYSPTIGSLTGNQPITLITGQTLTSGSKDSNGTYNGVFSGSGDLAKTGSGAWTLTDNHTHSGDTTISAGSIVLFGSGALANSAVNLDVSGPCLVRRKPHLVIFRATAHFRWMPQPRSKA